MAGFQYQTIINNDHYSGATRIEPRIVVVPTTYEEQKAAGNAAYDLCIK